MKQNPPAFRSLEVETEGGGGRTGLEAGRLLLWFIIPQTGWNEWKSKTKKKIKNTNF